MVFQPSDLEELEVGGSLAEVEVEMPSDEDDGGLEGDGEAEEWVFPPSGRSSDPPMQAAASAPLQVSSSDPGLFGTYGLPKNWELAPELATWLVSIIDKEVPFHVLKSVNENYVPSEDLQPHFVAPTLPAAISSHLYTAPKALSRVPKLVNSTLLRVQKELCTAYKPILEVLNFFYGPDSAAILESLPGMKDKLAQLKLLLVSVVIFWFFLQFLSLCFLDKFLTVFLPFISEPGLGHMCLFLN